jgi:hypothetical protein
MPFWSWPACHHVRAHWNQVLRASVRNTNGTSFSDAAHFDSARRSRNAGYYDMRPSEEPLKLVPFVRHPAGDQPEARNIARQIAFGGADRGTQDFAPTHNRPRRRLCTGRPVRSLPLNSSTHLAGFGDGTGAKPKDNVPAARNRTEPEIARMAARSFIRPLALGRGKVTGPAARVTAWHRHRRCCSSAGPL